MQLIDIQSAHGHLKLSLDELITLSNIMNELCYGIGMSDADFQVRIGASSSEVSELLTQLLKIIDKIEKYEKDDSAFDYLLLQLKKRHPSLFKKLFELGDGYNIPVTVNY